MKLIGDSAASRCARTMTSSTAPSPCAAIHFPIRPRSPLASRPEAWASQIRHVWNSWDFRGALAASAAVALATESSSFLDSGILRARECNVTSAVCSVTSGAFCVTSALPAAFVSLQGGGCAPLSFDGLGDGSAPESPPSVGVAALAARYFLTRSAALSLALWRFSHPVRRSPSRTTDCMAARISLTASALIPRLAAMIRSSQS